MHRLASFAAVLLLVAGCNHASDSGDPGPSSPSGGASSGGGAQSPSPHPHDFALTDGWRYEKNGEVKLPREYWIIIVDKDGVNRAMLPRPDGDARIVEECGRDSELAKLFRDAQLCTSASSQAAVARVNALTASEATRISTFLHSKLRFVVKSEPVGVDPYPLKSDMLDICKRFPERASVLQKICDDLLRYEAAGGGAPEVGIIYSPDEARVIAMRLNELYGIPIE